MANPRTIARLESRIHERAAHCLQFEIRDPRASFVTITRVEVSPDLSLAKIYYSVLGDEGDRSKVEHMLEHATGYIQRQVVSVLRMRRAPSLRFHYDISIETAAALDELIREARERDRRIDPTLAEREANEARLAAEEVAAREAERIRARDEARAALEADETEDETGYPADDEDAIEGDEAADDEASQRADEPDGDRPPRAI